MYFHVLIWCSLRKRFFSNIVFKHVKIRKINLRILMDYLLDYSNQVFRHKIAKQTPLLIYRFQTNISRPEAKFATPELVEHPLFGGAADGR